MKMEVLTVQSNYAGILGSNKVRDWTSTLTPRTTLVVETSTLNTNTNNNNSISSKHSIKQMSNNNNKISSSSSSNKSKQTKPSASLRSNSLYARPTTATAAAAAATPTPYYYEEEVVSSDIDAAAVDELSLRILDELRKAKSRHLTCTEVSLPCDLTPNIAADIIRVSEKEPCGIRGATIYIEFEDEPQNSRRIASLKLDPETVSTFEVYLTLRQDHRGWAALLPPFLKSLARTITISPEYSITKHKLYSADNLGARRSYSFGSSSQAIATPTN